uniref:Ras-related protein Rab n=1 Tax=Stomoxys calcitrans TaxID=35570 RepID=A0A1I8NYM2_STOCA
MATSAAIIRDREATTATTVQNASTTKRVPSAVLRIGSNNNNNHCRRLLEYFFCIDWRGNSSQSSTDSLPYQLSIATRPQPPSGKRRLPPITDQTLDFRGSFSSTVCNCTKCPKVDFKFVNVNSFSKSNISSSTAFDNTTINESITTEESDTETSNSSNTTTSTLAAEGEHFYTPPREYTTNPRALGQLTEKRSPLFGSAAGGISLRTQEPFYSEYLLNANDLISPKSLKAYKENIDYTATEALLSMNGGKRFMNGSVTSSPASTGNGGVTDINRNGVPKHWTIMTSTNAEKREHLYKILVIGELGTGKTSFIKRYVHQFFSQNYRATIGVDFALKVLHWDPNTIVRLQLWDIAGQERFGNMTRVYYKEAVGAFIVFDVTRSGTFDCVNKWKEDLDSKVQLPDGSPIPCILLANKCDQDKQGVVTNTEKMDDYVKEHGFAGWFETSAKENINIDEAARALVNKILLNDKLISASDLADNEKFNLNNSGDQSVNEDKSKCAC